MSFQSFSVPTSPATSRSTKVNPVTPQRLPRHQHRHSQSFYRSPITPSTPYTPLSLRSFTSTNSDGSSTLTTPNSIGDLNRIKRLSFASPEVTKDATTSGKDKSLADIAENWRSRASENGIKVSSENLGIDDSHFGDDEASDRTLSDATNDSGFMNADDPLLPPPFLSNPRRSTAVNARPRAQSHAPLPASRTLPLSPTVGRTNRAPPVASPVHSRRTLSSLNLSQNLILTSTPPQNRALARQLKLKGSFTDPAHTRRREAFGVVRNPSNNNMNMTADTSLELFDIDENDFECDYDYQQVPEDEGSFNVITNNNAYPYPIYQHSGHLSQQQQYFSNLQARPLQQPAFSDPFYTGNGHALSSISESVEHHFHAVQQQQPGGYLEGRYYPYQQGLAYSNPAYVPIPPAPADINATYNVAPPSRRDIHSIPNSPHQISALVTPKTTTKPLNEPSNESGASGCSVCLTPNPRTLAILVPCGHPLCSGCLTSALNIVGEKDMQCAVCKRSVADFRLVVGSNTSPARKGDGVKDATTTNKKRDQGKDDEMRGQSFLDPLFSSPSPGGSSIGAELDSAFELGEIRVSTPRLGRKEKFEAIQEKRKPRRKEDNVVLRIDNVPWDITPPQIKKWLQQPVERVHVLLDNKGKTMSHAFVEVRDGAVAGAILRGEGKTRDDRFSKKGDIGKKERGSVLGKGRRARGVTITRSGQEELMADLFPHWRGTFDGSRPSLAGLDGENVIIALEGGLMTEFELKGLLQLIREPDSHFLKVPCLPFHSLISILSKFPTDVDSRVFWSAGARDLLHDVTHAAIEVLASRVNKSSSNTAGEDAEYPVDLISELVQTAMDCCAFTDQQINKLSDLIESCSLPLLSTSKDDGGSSESGHGMSEPRTPANTAVQPPAQTIRAETHDPLNELSAEGPFSDLAREFGVEAQLVQALAQRLSGMS